MGMFVNMLAWKAERASSIFVKADQWFSSTRTCSGCGQIHDMPLSIRRMSRNCGTNLDRDENAAINQSRSKTRRETGEQDAELPLSVPVSELRILIRHGADAPY